jgi:hypothetical protein
VAHGRTTQGCCSELYVTSTSRMSGSWGGRASAGPDLAGARGCGRDLQLLTSKSHEKEQFYEGDPAA